MTALLPPILSMPAPPRRYPLAHVTFGEAEIAAVTEALRAGRTTMGPRVAAFEDAFAATIGVKHAVMVNSGSSADLLLAFGLGPPTRGRDEILVPAVTWPTQVWACTLAGYTVRLVDCDPRTLQMDLDDLEAKISDRTKAVFAVHALGNVGELDWLLETTGAFGAVLLEDCCEALGARYNGQHVGTFGNGGAFSFFFSHLLTTMEGGMVVTNDDEAAVRYRLWRNHGWEPLPGEHFHFPTWGLNLRPTEVQGAFGSVQLGRVPAFQAARTRNFAALWLAVRPHGVLTTARIDPHAAASWHAFPLLVRTDAPFTRTALCTYLEEHGIETRPMIAGNLARQPAAAHHPQVIAGQLPGADAIHERGFYLGLPSFDDPDGTAYVGSVIDEFMRQYQ